MWNIKTSKGFEVRKVRDRIAEYLHGIILDVGCGDEKVCSGAIGIDYNSKAANIQLDLSAENALKLFNEKSADVVFSSHFLEDMYDYAGVLKEFWRVLGPGGHLILYLPHKDLYPNVGEEGANINHKQDFLPSDILSALDKFASYKLIRNDIHNEDDEYSFELIIQKLDTGKVRLKITNKSVVVIRYGGFGDMCIMSPVFRLLKKQGYHTVANVTPNSKCVLDNNPYIDEFLVQEKGVIPSTQLGEYFKALEDKYGKVINLCESVERTLLYEERDKEKFNLPHTERHAKCNVNYSDRTMEMAGLEERGMRPEIYLSETEEILGKIFQQKHQGFFKVLFQVSGSSWHKLYPFADEIMEELLNEIPNIKFFITGGDNVRILQWDHPRICSRIGIWSPRQAMIMPKFMELVVSPETGLLNASGAFGVPKIGLLTHSSKENLTKYFINDHSIQSEAPCSPCHRLVETLEACPLDKAFHLPICMSKCMPKDKIKNTIINLYNIWNNKVFVAKKRRNK